MEQDNGRENFRIGLDTTQLYSDAQGARAAFERLGTSAENVGRRIDQSLGRTDTSAMRRELADMRTAMEQTARQAQQSGESIDCVFSQLKATAASLGVAFSAKEMITTLATVRGKYQQYQMALETMLGSTEKAAEKMQEFAQLAAITPFGMDDVVQGAKQLMAYGIETDKVTDTMRRLGDVAAGLGLNLNDLAWLYGTTAVQGRLFTQDFRQFTGRGIPLAEELAKQFGVTKDKVQELVTAGKVGFPEVEKAIKAMTDEGGKFGGLMENQSKSITGRISNIEDTIEQAINDIGKQTEGAMYSALDGVTFVVEHWKEVGEAILTAAEAIGLYKAATVGIAAFQASAANIGYDAEIAQLATIIPQKEAAANADLQEAVASGKLTEAKAAQVAAMREEAAVRVQELEAKAKSAALTAQEAVEEYNVATAKAANASLALDEAQEKVEAAEHAYEAILQYGDAEAISTAEENLNSAAVDRNIAARNLQTARTEVGTAAKRVDATAQAASTAQNELHTASTNLDTAATTRDTAAKGLWAQVVTLCKRAQETWNASMFSSPLFWIAAAIAGATYAIYKMVTAETAEEAAIRKTNEAWDEYNQKVQDKKQKIESLIRTIQDQNATELEQAEAYRELKTIASSITNQYSQAQLAAMDFGEAQKNLNKEFDADKLETARNAVEELEAEYQRISMTAPSSVASSTMATQGSGSSARALEETEARLAEAKKKYQELIDIQREVEENARPIELRLQEAQDNEKVTQKIFDFYDEAMVLASDWQAANETINFATGETRLDAFIAKARGELEDLHAEVEKNPLDLNLQMEEREKTKILNELLAWKANAEANGDTNVPLTFVSNYQTILDQLDAIKKKAAGLAADAAKSTTSYADAYNAAKADRDAKQKKLSQIKANKGAYTQKQYEDAVAEADAADEAFQKLGGSSIKSDASAANKAADAAKKAAQKAAADAKRAAEDARRRRQQQAEEQRSWNEQQTKTEQEAANAAADLEVARIKNEGERKREENRRQHEKNLQQIEEQANEYRKATFEHNKKLWEISNTDKTKSYEDTAAGKAGWKNLSLTKDQQAIIDAAIEQETLDYTKKQEDAIKQTLEAEQQAMQDYLKQYGTLQEQKLALDREYAEKRKKIMESSDTNEQKRWQLASLEQQHQSETLKVNAQSLAMDIDWGATFGDIGHVLGDVAKETLDRVEAFMKTAEFKSLSATDKQSYTTLRQNLKNEVGNNASAFNFGIWGDIQNDIRAYQASVKQLQEANAAHSLAVAQLINAEKKLASNTDETQQDILQLAVDFNRKRVEQTGNAVRSAQTEKDNSKEDLDNDAEKAAAGLQNFQNAMQQLSSGSLKGFADGVTNLITNLTKTDDAAGAASKGLSGLGKVGGIIGAILSIIDALGDDPARFISDLFEKITKAVENIIADLPNLVGNVVVGVFNVIKGVVSGISQMFGGSAIGDIGVSDKNYEEDMERLRQSNNDLAYAIDSLAEIMADQAGAEATATYENQKADLEQREKNLQEDIIRSGNQSSKGFFGIGSKGSTRRYIDDNMSASDWEKVSQAAGVSVKGASDFFNLTSEQMHNVATYASAEWTKIMLHASDGMESIKDQLNEYVDLWSEADDALKNYQETLTSLSFDSLKDSMAELLESSETDTEDVIDNINMYLQKAIINTVLTKAGQNRLEAWYTSFAEAMSDGVMTATESAALRTSYAQIYDEVNKQYEAAMQAAGLDPDDFDNDESGSSGSWESLGEETGRALEGRFAALQIQTTKIADIVAAQYEANTQGNTQRITALSEMNNLVFICSEHLERIAKNTDALPRMEKKLESIKTNTDRL